MAGAALPDLRVDDVRARHACELHVRAVRERWMMLEPRAERTTARLARIVDEDDAVRIPDRHGGDDHTLVRRELERHLHRVARHAAHRNGIRPERRCAHLDRDALDAAVHQPALAADDATRGLDAKRHAGDVAVVVEVLREDPQPVSRLLGFAAVGVEDAHPGIGPRARHVHEHTVRPDAAMAIAKPARARGVERALRQVGGPHDEVVVAQAVAFDERNHRQTVNARGRHNFDAPGCRQGGR